MLVYGDRSEFGEPDERLAAIGERLAQIERMPAGIERHAQLVGALIESGRVQQGVEDGGAHSPALSAFVHRLAQAVVNSSDSRFEAVGELPPLPAVELPRTAEFREPEGFAFYAVYPEAYAAAARKLRLSGPPRVIGIRSIGTTLGAIVAAALGAPPAITVRPFGDPFARRVELPDELIDERSHYVIVDEGPGLSGSSFGAVADWLEQRGVRLERIAFVPSHGGDPGAEASDAHRARWRRAQRSPAEFDCSFLSERFGPLEPLSNGAPWERRKFIGWYQGKRVLLKFAGLGTIGEGKLVMSRALHAAGVAPQPLGLAHGFLVERWCEHAQPLSSREAPVEEIGRYIGTRAKLFPAPEGSGATVGELLVMSRRNAGLALGKNAARRLNCWESRVAELGKRVRRVRTDNKLDREEWLRLAGGQLFKTDAVDHHRGHDLIGCQDAAWDVAGAIAEFELDETQARRLITASSLSIDAELLAFYRLAYAAFRVGQATLSGETTPRPNRRARALDHLLHEDSCARDSAQMLG